MAESVQELRRAGFLAEALTEAAIPPEVTGCLSGDSVALFPPKRELCPRLSRVETLIHACMFQHVQ